MLCFLVPEISVGKEKTDSALSPVRIRSRYKCAYSGEEVLQLSGEGSACFVESASLFTFSSDLWAHF